VRKKRNTKGNQSQGRTEIVKERNGEETPSLANMLIVMARDMQMTKWEVSWQQGYGL